VIARYFGWRKKATLEGFNSGHRAPRLIVNGSLQLVLAVCTAIGVSIVSTLCVVEMLGFDYREFVLGRLMAEVNKYAVGVIVPLGGLLILLIPKLRPGFDMMLDVVNHFYFRATNVQDALDDDDEFDIIVAHSQGTMIAIEALNDDDLSWLNNCFSSVTLVTMGSPLNHLYQHYFGHCYPALDQPFWSAIRRRLDSWVNVCRMDDFVGTQMDFPTGDLYRRDQSFDQTSFNQTSFNQTVFSNHAVGARGHTNYWSDREVLAILRRELFSQDDFEARRSA
jgi:hypothetical protein